MLFPTLLFLGAASAAVVAFPRAPVVRTMIPKTCFSSQADFDADFANLYPWGSDHNGGARMANSQIEIANNILTLTATPKSGEKPASSGGKSIPVHYLSGTVHAKEHFNVSKGGGYDFTADFMAATTKGAWPAFWLTAVNGWPPEVDIAEWKGSGKISFNTFNTSSVVSAKDVTYSSPDSWHTVKCEIRDSGNGKDLSIKFFMDGKEVTTQYGKAFLGKPMWLVIDLQMEGSSGSPGPTGNTKFSIRNLEVLSYNP